MSILKCTILSNSLLSNHSEFSDIVPTTIFLLTHIRKYYKTIATRQLFDNIFLMWVNKETIICTISESLEWFLKSLFDVIVQVKTNLLEKRTQF